MNNEIEFKRICVYCGSSVGKNPIYLETAKRLGIAIASARLGLVYGGGNSGLMGALAKSVIDNGGHVTGIMPKFLAKAENAKYNINEYHEVNNYHERKMLMYQLSEAFIALPGGPGTLEEIVEQLAWMELGYHQKPIFIINTNEYWTPLLNLLIKMQSDSLINSFSKINYAVVDEPEQAIKLFLLNN